MSSIDPETLDPKTFSGVMARLTKAISDMVETVAEALRECIARGFRDADRIMRKLMKALDPRWQRRRRRALARSRRNNLYLKSIGRCR